MQQVLALLLLISLSLMVTPRAHAIVFLPAIILIPIAKIIAVIIGGFSLPSLGGGLLWHKLFGTSLRKTLSISVFLLILIGIGLFFFLHFQNPDRPWI